ncbi:SUKH-4 family immunity protein [Actinoplanes sp. CA-131856]
MELPSEHAIGASPPTALQLLTAADGRPLVKSGEWPRHRPVRCLDPASGHVVDMRTDSSGLSTGEEFLLNSSLEQYVATVREATARFPYDNADAEDAGFELATGEQTLREALEPIDPVAWSGDPR